MLLHLRACRNRGEKCAFAGSGAGEHAPFAHARTPCAEARGTATCLILLVDDDTRTARRMAQDYLTVYRNLMPATVRPRLVTGARSRG